MILRTDSTTITALRSAPPGPTTVRSCVLFRSVDANDGAARGRGWLSVRARARSLDCSMTDAMRSVDSTERGKAMGYTDGNSLNDGCLGAR